MTVLEKYPNKKLLLEHVLYEMEMYLYTEKILRQAEAGIIIFRSQLPFNTFWNANRVAMRNLMSFWGIGGKVYKTDILIDGFSFSAPKIEDNLKEKCRKYYRAISKAIDHITTERYLGFEGVFLDDIVIEARSEMFPIISGLIAQFLNALKNNSNITYFDKHTSSTIDIIEEMRLGKHDQLIDTICMLLDACNDASIVIVL